MSLALLLPLLVVSAKPNPYLAQAKVFFQGGDYKQCLKRIEQAQKWDSSLEEQVDVALYGGLCNFQLRKTKEAEADFTLALKLNPKAALPPLTSPKVVQLFESLRPKEETAAAAPSPPPPAAEPAAEEPPREKPSERLQPREPEAPPAAVVEAAQEPQVRSGVPIAPIVLGAVAVAMAGTSVYFGANARSLDGQARAAEFFSDAAALRRSADTQALVANVGFAVAGALAVTALIVFFVTR